MADGKLGHVVLLLAQADEVVVYPRLVLAGVVEIEIFRLHVVFGELFVFEFRNVFQEPLFLLQCHAPYDHSTVLEEEDFWRMHLRVEIQCIRPWWLWLLHFRGCVIGYRALAILERRISGPGGQVDEILSTVCLVSIYLHRTI